MGTEPPPRRKAGIFAVAAAAVALIVLLILFNRNTVDEERPPTPSSLQPDLPRSVPILVASDFQPLVTWPAYDLDGTGVLRRIASPQYLGV